MRYSIYDKANKGIPTFKLFDLANITIYQGTKENSGYVALTCNVDLGWESEYVKVYLKF